MKQKTIKITALGSDGDGVAVLDGKPVYVPFTLSGDEVRVNILKESQQGIKAELLEIFSPSLERVPAPCPHFAVCGGCLLQHLNPISYQSFKKNKVIKALQQRGFTEPTVRDVIILPEKIRRRANLKALRKGSKVILGYNKRNSHEIIDIQSCLVVLPEIEQLIPKLRTLLANLSQKTANIAVNATKIGIDLLIELSGHQEMDLALREHLTEFARINKLARLTLKHDDYEDLIVMFHQPTVSFSGINVETDATCFLQASEEADKTLSNLMNDLLPKSFHKAADLFCGRGTFSFKLAQLAHVHAFEIDEKALSSLQKAANKNQKNIQPFRRNLFTDPLTTHELKAYDVVVLDPPRVGAKEQCVYLAESTVPTILYISCNPATFPRDAKTLCDGGYVLTQVTPVDQFLWSSHVELVAGFTKT